MNTWGRTPLLILCAAVVASAALLASLGQFSPVVEPDTQSYQNLPLDSLHGALGGYRTVGYPLFLRLTEPLAANGQAIPYAQFALHVLAVLVFYRGLRPWVAADGLRAAVAGVLLFSHVLLRYNASLITDAPASSLAILTVGWLLWLVREPKRMLLWFAFGCSLFATCQTRAAYVFLVPLAPLLGLALWRIEARSRDTRHEPRTRFALALCAVSAAPLLAFCLLRWSVVGEFGIVSFSGYELMGVAGQFLDHDFAAQLPADVRPLAEAGLERQKKLAQTKPNMAVGVVGHYLAMEQRYDSLVWEVYAPAADALYGSNIVLKNRRLQHLATTVLAARPKLYAMWLVKAVRQGFRMLAIEFVGHPLNLFLLAALFAAWAWRLLFQQRNLANSSENNSAEDIAQENIVAARNLLMLVGIGFALSKLLLVVLLAPPYGRYMDAGGVFLPTVLVAAVWEQASRTFR